MNETIINGIDVSECEFYFEDNGVIAPDGTPERANICTSPERSCENNDSCYCNKDCYFKQLKRLQKENESLKSLNDFNVQKIEVLKEEHSKLIHKYNDLYEKYREKEIEEPKFKEEIKRYDKLSIKYSQALEEIRNEIGDLKNINRLINLQKILDIINEVSNDDLK